MRYLKEIDINGTNETLFLLKLVDDSTHFIDGEMKC